MEKFFFLFEGPKKYTGKTLKNSHFHIELQNLQFDKFKSLFIGTLMLNDFKVPEEIIQDLEEFMEDKRSRRKASC